MDQPASPVDRDRYAALLRRIGVDAAAASAEPLLEGVSSGLFRVELAEQTVCVKCARPRVADEWVAPVARSRTEHEWLALVARRLPEVTPAILGFDRAELGFAMPYPLPDIHPVWKARLLAGTVEPAFAAAVDCLLSAIHTSTTGDPRPVGNADGRSGAAARTASGPSGGAEPGGPARAARARDRARIVLALARVDGDSPLGYLDEDRGRSLRANSLALLARPLGRVEPMPAELAR